LASRVPFGTGGEDRLEIQELGHGRLHPWSGNPEARFGARDRGLEGPRRRSPTDPTDRRAARDGVPRATRRDLGQRG
jgi:hypothetical protein